MARKRETPLVPQTGEASDDDSRPNGALLRGLEVLQAFKAGHGMLGNKELAQATGLPKATLSRLTRALVEAGYLAYDPSRAKYQLRPRVLKLGFSLIGNLPILPAAHDHMRRFANESGCAVSLAAADDCEMIYLDRCTGETMPYFFSTGSTIEMARTAGGHAYLAGLPEAERQDMLARLATVYSQSCGSEIWSELLSQIARSVAEIETRGFCLVDRTWRRNIRAIAAPLLSRDGRQLLAVSCVAPIHTMETERLIDDCGPRLLHLVETLAQQF
jgi:DNA-binding IclR family transcriptional regulator